MWLLLVRVAAYPSASGSPFRPGGLAYGGPVAVAERDLTSGAARGAAAGVARLFPWRGVVAPWLLSRVVSIAVLLAAVNDPVRGSRFVQVATRWDGAFYLDIARFGYGPVDVDFPKWPFFPLLPGLIRALSEVADDKAAIFVVNQVLFLVALAGVYRLAARHGGTTVAQLSVWSLALFPASFVFSMTYPSAIFLAASVWAFVLVEDEHDLAAGWSRWAPRWCGRTARCWSIALVVAVHAWRRALLVAGPSVVAVAAWCVYCWDRTGDPLVFLTTKSRWQEITFVGLFEGHVKWSVLPHVLLAIGALAVLVVQRKRLPVAWLVFGALYLIPSLQLGMVGVGRYANECFPPFVGDRSAARALVVPRAGALLRGVDRRPRALRLRRRPLRPRPVSETPFWRALVPRSSTQASGAKTGWRSGAHEGAPLLQGGDAEHVVGGAGVAQGRRRRGGVAVTRVEHGGVGEGGQAAGEALVHRVGVGAGQVGAAAALEEERVAGDQAAVDHEALAARACAPACA